jgi:S-DNA-T family DNA segregation ATPase FtsK/SpoIIIE
MTAEPISAPADVELPSGSLQLQPPPDKPEGQGMGNALTTTIPMMGSMGVMVVMAFTQGSNGGASVGMGGGMIVSMFAMIGVNIYRQVSQQRRKVKELRAGYLGYLSTTRDQVRQAANSQRQYSAWQLPSPDSLVFIADQGSRVWERHGPDALNVRLGTSTQDLTLTLETPELAANANPDAVCQSALARFVAVHSLVDQVPFGVSLSHFSRIDLVGDDEPARAQARAMLAHLITLVSPDVLKIAVFCAPDRLSDWEWLKWTPHARSAEVDDALGAARMVTSDYDRLTELLGSAFLSRPDFLAGDATSRPHLLLIDDGAGAPPTVRFGTPEGIRGVTMLRLQSTPPMNRKGDVLVLKLHPGLEGGPVNLEVSLPGRLPIMGFADALSLPQAEAIARRMAPWSSETPPEIAAGTSSGAAVKSDPKRAMDLMELLGIGDIRDFDPERQWVRREGRERLNVPFAVTPEGAPVFIDIKESAQQGMGPHGLLIGATGSGKSEVLRTVVLALTLTHSPEQLNLVLVDFKGGATFAGMAELPHVSAMISNLESELSLVDRMQDALTGEMTRRQEQLRKAGNYANVTDYEADRIAGKHHEPPLPALFIILDEFSEMLSAKPEFIDTFVAIGRLGRSMSIHLLLSSQRLEEGKLKGLDSHLSYRIGLRTFSAGESRTVLGVPDAFELPPYPGVGYLKAGSSNLTRFRASYVAAPPPARKAAPGIAPAPTSEVRPNLPAIELLPFTVAAQAKKAQPEVVVETPAEPVVQAGPTALPGDERWADMTEMDIAVEKMRGKGIPAHQVWLPPLDVPDTYDELLPDLAEDPELGLISKRWRDFGVLRFPIGTMDVPLEQRRQTLFFDLSGAGGHFAVIGRPLSGKSTMLRSMVMGMSLTMTPLEAQFYILDFGGGTFTPFDGAAHIAGVATRDQPDVVNRTIAELEGLMEDREKFFRANRIDSMDTYRRGRAEGRFDDGYGDVFLIVDGWSTIRADFEDLENRIQLLGARGLGFGIHLLIGAGRWMEIRQQLRDVIGSVFELRMGDPSDSVIDRKLAKLVPEGRPGRGIEVTKHHALIALPRADGDPQVETLAEGVQSTLLRIQQAWKGKPAPKLRLLPERIGLDELLPAAPNPAQLVLGIEESRMRPLCFDPKAESHMYLFGDAKSGKTTFLRSLGQEIIRAHTPAQARLVVIDLRRSLLGEFSADYLFEYLTSKEDAAETMGELAEYLQTRLPGKDVTPEQLRSRSWWTGPELHVLIDDYDLVATAGGNPVAPLQPFMAQAGDVGLHVYVARRMGGAGRAMYDPIIQAMTETGSTGILLSGNPEEGAIIGRVKPIKSVAGRAQVITRDAGRLVAQLAWTNPSV